MRSPFYTQPVTADNFDTLQSLVQQQIAHHNVTPQGESRHLLEVLAHDRPDFHGFLLYHEDADVPLAYALYQDFITGEGRGIYLQDFCVTEAYRRGGERPRKHAHITGIGRQAFAALTEKATKDARNFILWSVSSDNEGALRFYESMGAERLARSLYDMTELKQAEKPDSGPGITAGLLRRDDLPHLPAPLRAAAKAALATHHTEVVAARNNRQVGALAFVNRLFSTFRNEHDIEVTPARFPGANANQQEELLAALLHALPGMMEERGMTGHIFCTAPADKTKPHKGIYKALGGEPDSFTDETQSTTHLFRLNLA